MQLSSIGLKTDSISPPVLSAKEKLGLTLKVKKEKARLVGEFKDWDGQQVPTAQIEEIKYPFEFLNPPQSEFFQNRFLDANFIISAATSAGKTVMAELSRNGKMLYLSPLKAISQEKWEDWSDEKHSWSKLNISISTGDYQITADRVDELRRADVIVMTSEMLDSRSRNLASEKNDWLLDIKTLVIDEFHLLGYAGRGDKLESAIIRFTQQNPACRIVCLSATMPNIGELSEWLTKLNTKRTVTIQSTYRPVTLHRHYTQYTQTKDYTETERIKVQMASNIVREHPNDKFIVFVHSKNTGRVVLEALDAMRIKAEFHSADLSKEERIRLQTEFNSKLPTSLKVLVSTSTLAWGVNTPADRVVLVGLHRGLNNLIENQDVHQMCGRAGRVGKTDKPEGHAYILIPNVGTDRFIEWCEQIKNVDSRMNPTLNEGINTLCFHILAEVLSGSIVDKGSLLKWYDRTFACHQGVELTDEDAETILSTLERIKMLKKNEAGLYVITGLGRVSAYLYYSPFDIYSWYRNFLTVKNRNLEDDNVALGWALGRIDSLNPGFVAKQYVMPSERWMRSVNELGLDVESQVPYCATYHSLLEGDDPTPFGLVPLKRQLQADFGRALSALRMIDMLYAKFGFKELWDTLEAQIRYGVGKHLIELVRMPQIGAKRAEKLYACGIRTREDFIKKPQLGRAAIGSSLYDRVLSSIQ